MTQIYNENGLVEPVTIVEAGPCVVVNLRTNEKNGYQAVQLGFGKPKKTIQAERRVFQEAGSRRKTLDILKEFRKDKLDGYSIGQEIKADAFKMNEVVSVTRHIDRERIPGAG